MSAMLLAEIAQASEDVAATPARLGKVARLADCLALASADEVAIAVAYLSGALPQGTVGVGWAALRELPPAADSPTLELLEVDAAVSRLQSIAGPGSQAARRSELDGLFSRATEPEQRLLVGLFLGELRQGALEGVMADAVAKAAGVPASRRAPRGDARRRPPERGGGGDARRASTASLASGSRRCSRSRRCSPRPPTTSPPRSSGSVARVSSGSSTARGSRCIAQATRCAIFTRNLADITDRAPEIVEAVQSLDVSALVLDGEAIALREDGRPEPFQVTMSRFGTKTDTAEQRGRTPLSAFFFDCLHLDGDDLIDAPARQRLAALDAHLPPELVVPRLETDDAEAAEAFLDDTLARGHEGVMVKSLDAPYEAGRRGAGWLKVKPVHTLDLVVLAAEWGHGRRRGKLSNLHLGARDPATGDFVMLGKTFKGLTDEMLAWQTEHLLGLRDAHGRARRPRPAGARRRGRVRRRPVEPALSGWRRAPVRPREGVPAGQVTGRRGHDRRRAYDPRARGVGSVGHRRRGRFDMTQYGTLRSWAFIATLVGIFGMIAAAIGAIVWAFEVEGFWQTLGVLLIGLPVSIFIATIPIALGPGDACDRRRRRHGGRALARDGRRLAGGASAHPRRRRGRRGTRADHRRAPALRT